MGVLQVGVGVVARDTARRRQILIDVVICTIAIGIGSWVATWSKLGVVILVVVLGIVIGVNIKKFHN